MKMRKLGFVLLVLLFGLAQIVVSQAIAGDENIKTMAQIMMNLNHYPSASEKETLREISLKSTDGYEKTMATAMINLEHAATAEDKQKLNKILQDDAAPEEVKTLAKIIHDLNHKPSSDDKKKLKDLM